MFTAEQQELLRAMMAQAVRDARAEWERRWPPGSPQASIVWRQPEPRGIDPMFKPGDVVRLKSGGPAMTVGAADGPAIANPAPTRTDAIAVHRADLVEVVWFSSDFLYAARFEPAALEPVTAAPNSLPDPRTLPRDW